MDETAVLAQRFDADRAHLTAVAYRMLGSLTDADDAVQEAWLRLSRTDVADVENLTGWLTTVVSRVCLDMLRTGKRRAEEPLDDLERDLPEDLPVDPEREALLADSVGMALNVVLGTLPPVERVAFVLHDMFGVPFDEIGPIVGRAPAAARQLASRARRRVQNRDSETIEPDVRRREIVEAFLAASREGRFDTLLALLDPDVVLRADATALKIGAGGAEGAQAVAETFAGRAKAARFALVDGEPALVWAQGGAPKVVFDFLIDNGEIVEIEIVADEDRLAAMRVELPA